jgi:hypothetical protein
MFFPPNVALSGAAKGRGPTEWAGPSHAVPPSRLEIVIAPYKPTSGQLRDHIPVATRPAHRPLRPWAEASAILFSGWEPLDKSEGVVNGVVVLASRGDLPPESNGS